MILNKNGTWKLNRLLLILQLIIVIPAVDISVKTSITENYEKRKYERWILEWQHQGVLLMINIKGILYKQLIIQWKKENSILQFGI